MNSLDDLLRQVCASRNWTTAPGGSVTVSLAEGRSQEVIAEPTRARGVRLLRLYSKLGNVADVDELRLRASLRLNWTQLYGSVAIGSFDDVEQLVMSALLPVASLDDSSLTLAIESLAQNADKYEQFVFGTDAH